MRVLAASIVAFAAILLYVNPMMLDQIKTLVRDSCIGNNQDALIHSVESPSTSKDIDERANAVSQKKNGKIKDTVFQTKEKKKKHSWEHTKKKDPRPCRDEKSECPGWANYGECDKNPQFMKRFCRRSCRVCTIPISPWKVQTWSDGPSDLLKFLGDGVGSCGLPRVDFRDFESPEDFFDKYRNTAVLIENALDESTMGSSIWTKEHFVDVFGLKTIELRDSYAFAHLGPDVQHVKEVKSMSMKSFLDKWTTDNDDSGDEFADGPPSFVFKYFNEVPSPSLMETFRGTRRTRNLVSLGRAGSGITFHDHHESWLGVVHGSKHWYLYAPFDLPKDESHRNLETAQLVLLNPTEWMTRLGMPTLDAFFEKASRTVQGFRRPIQCTQNAGELMWLPHYWWHATVNLVDTLSFGGQNHGIPDKEGDAYKGVGLTNAVMESWDIRSLQEETNEQPWTKYPGDWRERVVRLQHNANYQLGKYMPSIMLLLESALRDDGWDRTSESWFWEAVEPMLADIHFLSNQKLVNIMSTNFSPDVDGNVAIVLRGECTFARKALMAGAAGAHALIVANTLSALYSNESTGILKNGCDVSCDVSASVSKDLCEQNSACESKLCAEIMNPSSSSSSLEYCCVLDDVGSVDVNATVTIPTVIVNIQDGEKLIHVASSLSSSVVTVDLRPVEFSSSVIALWLLGVVTVALSSLRGAWQERIDALTTGCRGRRRGAFGEESGESSKQDNGDDADADGADDGSIQSMVLTPRHVATYLIVASATLLIIYFLVTMGADWIVMMIIVMFCFASVSALSVIVLEPVVNRVCPCLDRIRLCAFERAKETITMSLGELVIFSLALTVVLFWFFQRHETYAWILQNALGVCLCCTFAIAVQVPNLKIASLLLGLFLLYDVVMVFLTPFLFSSSVMLEVATAGGSDGYSSEAGTNSCVRHYGERMPMLFMIPRSDWAGGYSMLGLGDVILPTTLLTLMLRADYKLTGGPFAGSGRRRVSFAGEPGSWSDDVLFRVGYFPILLACYGLGLFLAFLANALHITINGVQGQPALLYLVPCTLFPSLYMARRRNELLLLWNWGSGDGDAAGDKKSTSATRRKSGPYESVREFEDEEEEDTDVTVATADGSEIAMSSTHRFANELITEEGEVTSERGSGTSPRESRGRGGGRSPGGVHSEKKEE
eukprot:g2362.t1